MKRNQIKLSEQELRDILKESIHKILSEDNSQKSDEQIIKEIENIIGYHFFDDDPSSFADDFSRFFIELAQYKYDMQTKGESIYEGDFDQDYTVEQLFPYVELLRKALQNHLAKLYQKFQQDLQKSNESLNNCVEAYARYKRGEEPEHKHKYGFY